MAFSYSGKGQLKKSVASADADVGFRVRELDIALGNLFEKLAGRPVEIGELFNGLVARLFSAIQSATPVDTGQARASWRLEKLENKDAILWRIVNGVPYIVFLEYGSSKQAPQGMVRVNLDKFIGDARNGLARLTK